MAKYDVYKEKKSKTLVVIIQADLLDDLNTRVVVPLMPLDSAPKTASGLNPVFEIQGAEYSLVTQFIATVGIKELGARVANLEDHSVEITNALDLLLFGL